ncbi:DUF805 domain-containing protein [Rhizobium sp. L1K21]|uniref:DUF805 domain-containing protein n=1 Tax=Rhizobium sp. L1K21 TaxID=2954933 RepID=UPI002092C923|nr:DUF805 domain-containing protein [Rhizobium sp. L1K21]MCO6185565.1 DUF805 domain-containing protein [Rhizobium sp. L1K21]
MTNKDPSAPSMTWLFFGHSGRIGRQPYILAFFFWVALSAFTITKLVIADQEGNDSGAATWFLATLVLTVASALSLFFLSFKRLHDLGLPGPLALSTFIPAVSILAVFALMVWPGTDGANQYGRLPNRPS